MTFKRVSPDEAKALIDREGYVYVDVRSVPEFEAGHPTGAYNVPLMHQGPAGMTPNPDFLDVMEKSFAKGRPVSIQSSSRAARGVQNATSTAATAITTNSSSNVKPLCMRRLYGAS